MRRLGWLTSLLLGRQPDAEFIRDDLQELYARDRAGGISVWRASWRHMRRLADSCISVWTARSATWMDDVHLGGAAQDLRFAVRLFRKHPTSTGIALVGLAVAMAVAVSVFTVVDAVMLRPYGMDDPDSVVLIDEPRHGWPLWRYSAFLNMQNASTLVRIEASLSPKVRFSAVSTPGAETNRRARFISGGYLAMLGGRPTLGRPIGPHDDLAGAPPVVMVSHHLWSAALGADPAAIGRTLWLNGTPVTLVGVMSPEFTGPSRRGGPAIWAPIAAHDDVLGGKPLTQASNEWVEVVARLAPGASPRAVEEELTAFVGAGSTPTPSGDRRKIRIESAASPVSGRDATEAYLTILFVFGIVGLVLAVACANTANLLLAAATTRKFEMGTRLALGASPARLFRQTLSESLLLSAVAGGLGFALSIWFVPVLRAMLDLPLELPTEVATRPDGRALMFTMAIGLVCGLGAGLSPARYGARGDVMTAMRSQTAAGARVMPVRLRSWFVGFQATVSIVLLIAAALLARSAMQSMRTDIGFDADQLLTIEFSRGATPNYQRTALEAIHALPMIEHVSLSQYAPYGPSVEREFVSQGGKVYQVNVARTDADYVKTLGLRIVRGRAFMPEEVSRQAPVALISESVARAFYQGLDPIGQPLTKLARGGLEEEPAAVVGIVADAQLSPLWSERFGAIYRPIRATPDNPPSLIVRARLPTLTRVAIRSIEDALKRVDPLTPPRVSIVGDEVDEYLGAKRMLSSLSAPIALLAAMLATVGVFGVTAFAVGQRTAEISVRMALGASAPDVCRMLIVDSLRPTVIGLVVGVAAALIASRGFASLLGGISPNDPLSILTAVGTLTAASVVAVLLPVRRAAAADPATLLRAG